MQSNTGRLTRARCSWWGPNDDRIERHPKSEPWAQIRPTGITALGLPTGSGKSILAYAGSDNLRAVVSTPTRALQQQYAHDPRMDCFVLMGRTSTHCVDGKGAVPPASGHYCMAARVSGTMHACGEHHCYSSTHQMDGQPMTGCVINVLRGMGPRP